MISPHTMTAAVGGTAMDTSERRAIFKRVTSDYVTYGPMRLALYQLAPSLIVSSSMNSPTGYTMTTRGRPMGRSVNVMRARKPQTH